MLREEEFRRVVDGAQPVGVHFVNAEFGRRSEAVFDAAEDAIEIMAVAFELQHAVHDVFQHLRPCDTPLLGDVADEQHGHALVFGEFQQGGCALTDLSYAAGRAFYRLGVHGLHRVDDEQFGINGAHLLEDALHARFAEEQRRTAGRRVEQEAVRAQFDLAFALLPAHIEDASIGHAKHGLEQKGAFADARFAAQED